MKQQYFEIVLEDINGKFDYLVEAIKTLQETKVDKSDFNEFREEMRNEREILFASIEQLVKIAGDHEKRLHLLELN